MGGKQVLCAGEIDWQDFSFQTGFGALRSSGVLNPPSRPSSATPTVAAESATSAPSMTAEEKASQPCIRHNSTAANSEQSGSIEVKAGDLLAPQPAHAPDTMEGEPPRGAAGDGESVAAIGEETELAGNLAGNSNAAKVMAADGQQLDDAEQSSRPETMAQRAQVQTLEGLNANGPSPSPAASFAVQPHSAPAAQILPPVFVQQHPVTPQAALNPVLLVSFRTTASKESPSARAV